MPGRSLSSANGYRYGFNGKENDNEVKVVEGSSLDFGARIYDTRLGKWLSKDNVFKASLSPYQYGSNNPVIMIDPDGKDEFYFNLTSGRMSYRPALGPNKFYVYADGVYNADGSIKLMQINPHDITAGTKEQDVALTTTKNTFIIWPFTIDTKDSYIRSFSKYSKADPHFLKLLENSKDPKDIELAGIVKLNATGMAAEEIAQALAAAALIIENGCQFLKARTTLTSGAGAALEGEGSLITQETKYTNLLKPVDELDPKKILYRGTTGSEAGAQTLFLIDKPEVAATYIKNGGSVMQYEVSQYSLKALEQAGALELKTGLHMGSNTVSTEYMFTGEDLIKALNKIAEPAKK